MITTIEDLHNATDEEILELYEKARKNTKDFQKNFNTEFSYSSLGTELTSRGYKNGYYKDNVNEDEVQRITVELDATTARRTYTLDEKVAQDWDNFCTSAKQKNLLLSAALEFFMDNYTKGNVEVNVKL